MYYEFFAETKQEDASSGFTNYGRTREPNAPWSILSHCYFWCELRPGISRCGLWRGRAFLSFCRLLVPLFWA